MQDVVVYHATSVEKAKSIEAGVLWAGSHWGTEEISEYYEETVEDEDDECVVISVRLSELIALNPDALRPDMGGIEEPLCYTLGTSEEEVHTRWDASAQDWQASFEIIKSFMFDHPVPARMLSFAYPEIDPYDTFLDM